MARRVYTQRMQEVLEPVAQSISILISRIEESEQDGVVLSDLTGPSAAVLAACKVCYMSFVVEMISLKFRIKTLQQSPVSVR
jgi:hypothetical protein